MDTRYNPPPSIALFTRCIPLAAGCLLTAAGLAMLAPVPVSVPGLAVLIAVGIWTLDQLADRSLS